jgi:cation/acetate symporter
MRWLQKVQTMSSDANIENCRVRDQPKPRSFAFRLTLYYALFCIGFLIFLGALAILEKEGFPREWIGYLFLFSTIVLYAGIGVVSRTNDVSEYFVAGRRVPAIFNGMATAADWISAASFISLAGGLYLLGFDGLAFIMGWTGGYCLVAIFVAPFLRKLGQFTIPDFLAARFDGRLRTDCGSDFRAGFLSNKPAWQIAPVRIIAVGATVVVSFIYLVAQIYGVGLITSRFTGVDFSVGIFLGLASILVCSFLGGMRAVTWTQIAQYLILMIAYMIPVVYLSVKHTGSPIPQLAYGTALNTLSQREIALTNDPKERQVRQVFAERADALALKIRALPASWQAGRIDAQRLVRDLKEGNASLIDIKAASNALSAYPQDPDEARRIWRDAQTANLVRAQPVLPHTTPFPGKADMTPAVQRNNFLALVLCLMLGTTALPHVLVRYKTTASVSETRRSVFWTLFFILLLYMTIPALAVLVKLDIYSALVGSDFARLPHWVSYWAEIDRSHPLVSITDINHDGIVQLAEIVLDGDMLVLATPEIAGLPYVISGLVAAGGLAAALATADGLLLTISNTLSHDIYYQTVDRNASTQKRVTVSKLLLLVVALVAAFSASFKPADILSVVGAAFSLAASTLFPSLVLGIFWKRANQAGAIAGMLTGFVLCVGYTIRTSPALGGSALHEWFQIAPIAAGIFGMPAGMIALIGVSLCTRAPHQRTQNFVDQLRTP